MPKMTQDQINQIVHRLSISIMEELRNAGLDFNNIAFAELKKLNDQVTDSILDKMYSEIRLLTKENKLKVMVALFNIYDHDNTLDPISRFGLRAYLLSSRDVSKKIKDHISFVTPHPKQTNTQREERAKQLLKILKTTPQAKADYQAAIKAKSAMNEQQTPQAAAPASPKQVKEQKEGLLQRMPNLSDVFKSKKNSQQLQDENQEYRQAIKAAKEAHNTALQDLRLLAEAACEQLLALPDHMHQQFADDKQKLDVILDGLEPWGFIAKGEVLKITEHSAEVLLVASKIYQALDDAKSQDDPTATQNKSAANAFRKNCVYLGNKLLASAFLVIEALIFLKACVSRSLGYDNKDNDAVANKKRSLSFRGDPADRRELDEYSKSLSKAQEAFDLVQVKKSL